MKFICDKGYGNSLANFIRQSLLTKMTCWRPIAFTIGQSSNVIVAHENCLEDATEVANNLCKYHYEIESEEEIVEISFTGKVLTAADMQDKVHMLDVDDKPIFHTISNEETVTVYFRQYHGAVSDRDNRAALSRYGVNADNIVILASRHCNYDSVAVNVSAYSEMQEEVEITINAAYPIDTDKEVQECCKLMAKTLMSVADSVN